MERRHKFAIAMLGIAALAAAHPVARLELVTHDLSDPAPRRFHAAADLGALGVSILVTWTATRLAR